MVAVPRPGIADGYFDQTGDSLQRERLRESIEPAASWHWILRPRRHAGSILVLILVVVRKLEYESRSLTIETSCLKGG